MSLTKPLTVRLLQAEDRSSLRALCARRELPDSIFMPSEQRRDKILEILDQHFEALLNGANTRCFVVEEEDGLTGFTLSGANVIEGTTGDLQTEIVDYYADTPRQFEPLIEATKEQARKDGDAYLVATAFAPQKRESMWLAKAGFVVETLRNAQYFGPETKAPQHPKYRLRKAKQAEMLFVMNLVTTHSPLYVPAGRPTDPQAIAARFMAVYSQLDVKDPTKVPLVMVGREDHLPVGYMILEPRRIETPGGLLTLYTYDVAVGDEAKGQGLGRYLNYGGMNLIAKMGGGIFFGDTPANLTLAQSASEALGFRPDSKRWGCKL